MTLAKHQRQMVMTDNYQNNVGYKLQKRISLFVYDDLRENAPNEFHAYLRLVRFVQDQLTNLLEKYD